LKKLSDKELIGKIYKSNSYGVCKIVSVINSKKVTVEFLDTGFRKTTTLCCIRAGKVKDPFYPYFYGRGYLGTELPVDKKVYGIWKGILRRCYSTENFPRHKSYEKVEVCKDWWSYLEFEKWYSSQKCAYIQGFDIDKDIMSHNCAEKEYSPKFCRLVPKKLNALFIKNNSKDSSGCYQYKKGSYYVQSSRNNKSVYLGKATNKQEAIRLYKNFQKSVMEEELNKYKKVLDEDVFYKIKEVYSIS